MAPFNALPNELVSAIFESLENDFDAISIALPLERRAPLNISGVSRRWHEIAPRTPKLWTKIDVLSHKLHSIYLLRSKQALLDVELCPLNGAISYLLPSLGMSLGDPSHRYAVNTAHYDFIAKLSMFFDPIILHAARWRSLAIACHQHSPISEFLHRPAPQLERFTVIAYGMDRHASVYDNSGSSVTFFAGHAPRLHDLTLYGIPISLDDPIFAGLTRMHLGYIACPIQVYQLMHNLAMCPSLEDLTLTSVKFVSREGITSSETILVHLPQLRHMILRMLQEWEMHYIFTSIIVPPTLQLRVGTHAGENDPSTIFPLHLDFQSNLSNLSHIRSLQVKTEIDDVGEFCRLCGGLSDGAEPLMSIDIRFRSDTPTSTERVLRHLGREFPLPHLKSLYLDISLELSTTAFVDMVNRLPAITTLSLRSCPASFIDSLIPTATSNPCALLHTLCIRDCDVAKDAVLEVAISRSKFGTALAIGTGQLRLLEISGCAEMDTDIVKKLEERSIIIRID